MSTTAIGRHSVWRTGDLLRMSFAGPLTHADAVGLRAMLESLSADDPCFFVVDMGGCTGIEADARKYLADWSRTRERQLRGIVAHGVSFAVRAMVTLTLSAIKFLGRKEVEVTFVKDEAQALKWVAARRGASR